MQVFYDAKPELLARSAIALGFFDGVHPGHQVVIGKAVEEAKVIGATAGVVTFRDHPRALTRGVHPLLLTVIEQRLELFERLGVEATLVLTFSEDLCRLSPREYVEKVLVGAMGARSICVGHNHHFGRDREGNPELLRQMGQELNFGVHVAPMVYVDGLEVSSSRIREEIASGHVDKASQLLSRHYSILGSVVKGEGRGRKLGFPTANLNVRPFQMVPAVGVYAGRALFASGEKIACVINVGHRPTFDDGQAGTPPLVEAHLFDYEGDLYDRTMQLQFVKFLRCEKKFDGVDALKRQIESDCAAAREVLAADAKRLPTEAAGPEQKLPA
ncbi:MAG TPA: bifunctional riboflavin kinase/FAD synthetase [Candidatus Obscuribacterales bacterium]